MANNTNTTTNTTTPQDEPTVVYDLSAEIARVMRQGLSQAGYELTDKEATLPVMLGLAVEMEEDDRLLMMANVIRLLDSGSSDEEALPELPEDELDDEPAGDGQTSPTDKVYGEILEGDLTIIDWANVIAQGYLDQPDHLAPDGDLDRLIARQKEMMDAVFGGIGEETKPAKRQGLAQQQLQLEQHQALRLALGFLELPELLEHLQRCLDDPAFGYGERGDNGRVIAQGLDAVSREDGFAFADAVSAWWKNFEDFRLKVYSGIPFSLRPLFDDTTIDTFLPVLRRDGETTWLLGSKNTGKSRAFEGNLFDVWHKVGDTVVEWVEAENEAWLEKIKAQAARLPFNIQYPAIADRLDKETWTVARQSPGTANEFAVQVSRPPQDEAWPRFLVFSDRAGISRLNGHGFYEASWGGGESIRRFELSATSRNRIPVEHTEVALGIAMVLAGPDAQIEPADTKAIEAAFLRRMKASKITLGPPPADPVLEKTGSTPSASFSIYNAKGEELVKTVWMSGGETVACAVINGETVMALQADAQNQVLAARPVVKKRVRSSQNVQTTPLNGIDWQPQWIRALCAWLGWLAWVLK